MSLDRRWIDADPEDVDAALLAFDPRRHTRQDRAGESERITGFAAPTEGYLTEALP